MSVVGGNLIRVTALALFAALNVGGSALHYAPFFGLHRAECGHAHQTDHGHAEHNHGHDHCCHSHDEVASDSPSVQSHEQFAAYHDCQLCHYYTQAKTADAHCETWHADLAVAEFLVDSHVDFRAERFSLFLARGPPSGNATIA